MGTDLGMKDQVLGVGGKLSRGSAVRPASWQIAWCNSTHTCYHSTSYQRYCVVAGYSYLLPLDGYVSTPRLSTPQVVLPFYRLLESCLPELDLICSNVSNNLENWTRMAAGTYLKDIVWYKTCIA